MAHITANVPHFRESYPEIKKLAIFIECKYIW